MTVNGESLRAALVETLADHGPGVYGLVTESGRAVFAESVGVADLKDPRPPAANDQYRLGSVTKMYTATLVLQLVADGLLAFDDTVEKLLPGLVPDSGGITVEMLLRLRSGLPDYSEALFGDSLDDLSALESYWSPRRVVEAALSRDGRVAPDTEYRHGNTEFILLGLMIEAATGERYDAQLWQRIIKPLGLVDTTLPTVDPYLRGPHATGHNRMSPDAGYTPFTTMTPSEGWSAGAMVATAADVAAFLDGLFGGALLPEAMLARMVEPLRRIDECRSTGLGVMRFDFGNGAGNVAYGYTGGSPGFSTVCLRTVSGRSVVLWQNGIELYNPMGSRAAFVQAALRP
ncbi:serine hydrolase domain-containing protein [Actinospica robiniae]|uniref:serine hydrolase domain-containing protein n=1 Tax=Actinospica robiniae TaxID=304901 RepID=UPI00040EA2C0|nr:serine hydrolase domain-containing protein [Actinospica robiniae]